MTLAEAIKTIIDNNYHIENKWHGTGLILCYCGPDGTESEPLTATTPNVREAFLLIQKEVEGVDHI